MLTERYSKDFIADVVVRRKSGSSFPVASDRAAWEDLLRQPLNQRRGDEIGALSENLLGSKQQILPVSGFAEFIRSGDRATYEAIYFSRRRDLAIAVLSTCFSPGDGRMSEKCKQGEQASRLFSDWLWSAEPPPPTGETPMLPDLLSPLANFGDAPPPHRGLEAALNIAWAICEETTWALPAHVDRRSPRDFLPEIRRPTLDIFSCQTASMLAETVHLLGKEFNECSPVIIEQIEGEIVRRVIEPFVSRNDFWWLSGENNWTPWCVSEILLAACHVIREPERLTEIILRCMEVLDRFIACYPDDGCCDEGAMYWSASPGALLVALETLHALSGGRISIYDEPKITAMAQYIGHIHLGGGGCFNYSDCPPRFGAIAARAYRFGERIGDDSLKDLGLLSLRGWQPVGEPSPSLGIGPGVRHCGSLLQALRELFWIPAEAVLLGASVSSGHWYPTMQVLVARSAAETAPPMVLGVKGGTNGVAHNHNDIGSFVLSSFGCPVIVDVGNAVYTRQTFSSGRYDMWWNASRGHNVLEFADHEQQPGADFHSELVGLDDHEDSVKLVFELAGAYLREVGVETWQRSYFLRRGGSPRVTIADSFRLRHPMKVKFPLFTPCPFALGAGEAVFQTSADSGVVMTWDPGELQIAPDELESDEPSLLDVWGVKLNKLLCRIPGEVERVEYQFSFEPCRLPRIFPP